MRVHLVRSRYGVIHVFGSKAAAKKEARALSENYGMSPCDWDDDRWEDSATSDFFVVETFEVLRGDLLEKALDCLS